jgi:hypothetical protein
MTTWLVLAALALVLAVVPGLVFLFNFFAFTRPKPDLADRVSVSLLIPARNEEAGIREAITAALASRYVDIEVVVLDDHSDDRTAAIVREMAAADSRVRLHQAPPLAAGWCGKQHACWHLAHLARHQVICWIDADVRLQPDGLASCAAFLKSSEAKLVSGFPHQVNVSLAEKLVIPLIQFVLLGFLPLKKMRSSPMPAFAAGCGQLFMTYRDSYFASGGHEAIKSTLHDGIKLPRLYRRMGLKTDLFDATQVADCRMYAGARAVWTGFAKNAIEGMAGPRQIWLWTLLLLGGQVMPWLIVCGLLMTGSALTDHLVAFCMAAVAAALGLSIRLVSAAWLKQSLLGALLHPLGILVLMGIQWYAFSRYMLGVPESWRGRPYLMPARVVNNQAG